MKQTDAALEARRKVKEARLVIVAECYSRGMSYRAIRSEVMSRLKLDTYSTRTVSNDIESLLRDWRKQRSTETELGVELVLERNRQHYQEVREEWDRSRRDRIKTENKKKGIPEAIGKSSGKGGEPGKITTILQEEKRITELGEGDPRYMELMIKLEDQRARVLGLYAPVKQEITGAGGEPLIPKDQMTREEIQEELKRIRNARKEE